MNIIYKFLDEYVGNSFSACKIYTTTNRVEQYTVISNKGKSVFFFWYRDESFWIFRSEELCGTVSSFLGIDNDDSARIIKNWFSDRAKISKMNDLFNLVNNRKIHVNET